MQLMYNLLQGVTLTEKEQSTDEIFSKTELKDMAHTLQGFRNLCQRHRTGYRKPNGFKDT